MKSQSSEEFCRSDVVVPNGTAEARSLASVIIPAYNAARFIEQTLDSVLAQCAVQRNQRIEIIVVDDGSTDDTLARVRAYGDRVRCISQHNSGGAAAPRNRALELATGEFVFFFDADDVMHEGKIRAALEVFAAEPAVGLVFTNFASIDDSGRTLRPQFLSSYPTIAELERNPAPYYLLPSKDAHARLLGENFIGTSGVAVRRSVMREIGAFNLDYYCGEDWDMWLRISRKHAIAYLPRVLHAYRRHDNNITASDSMHTIPSQIAMLSGQLRLTEDPQQRDRLARIIAGNEFSLAYAYYRNGRNAEARASLSRAKGAVPAWKILWMHCKTLLGVQTTTRIKRLLGLRRS